MRREPGTQRVTARCIKIQLLLTAQFQDGFGKSRHGTKQKGQFSKQSDKIHSKNTFNTYRQQGKAFAAYAKQHGYRHLRDIPLEFAAQWLSERSARGDSPSTLKTRGAALAKIFRCSLTDFGFKFPVRSSDEITRSRGEKKMDSRLNEELHKNTITLAKGCGFRRHELQKLRRDQLDIRADGSVCIKDVKGKGGRIRDIPVLDGYREWSGEVCEIDGQDAFDFENDLEYALAELYENRDVLGRLGLKLRILPVSMNHTSVDIDITRTSGSEKKFDVVLYFQRGGDTTRRSLIKAIRYIVKGLAN